MLKPQELFEKMTKEAVFHCKIGFNRFIHITPESFAQYQQYFEPDKYQQGKWRYGGLVKNLHALPTPDGYINVHIDYGNPNKNVLIGGLIHGIID